MTQDRARPLMREQYYTDQYLSGYRAPCYQALWKRILRWGGPRVLSYLWVALCLWLALTSLFAKAWYVMPGIAVLWVVVQAVIVLLTQWDLQFDAVLRETPKYHTRVFDAG